jgi:hypothetical protein
MCLSAMRLMSALLLASTDDVSKSAGVCAANVVVACLWVAQTPDVIDVPAWWLPSAVGPGALAIWLCAHILHRLGPGCRAGQCMHGRACWLRCRLLGAYS